MGLRKIMRSWERWRLLASAPDIVSKSKSQLHQDLWVLAETRRKRGGFFVEIGALDGVRHSNTHLLEKEFGWTGIIVEPNPDLHPLLRRNRSAALSTKAVYSSRGSVDFLRITGEAELSAIADNAYDGVRGRHSTLITVDSVTLNDLLQEHGAPRHIDYLSIDTEGSEFEILSAFDFNANHIALMSVEHNFSPREIDTERLLQRAGFRRVYRRISRWDAWYKRDH